MWRGSGGSEVERLVAGLKSEWNLLVKIMNEFKDNSVAQQGPLRFK